MLQLLPKDVVNYIYTIIHQCNTRYIVDEYLQKVYTNMSLPSNQNNLYLYIRQAPKNLRLFNNRFLASNYTHTYSRIFNIHDYCCAKLPERYKYSSTRQELQSMTTN